MVIVKRKYRLCYVRDGVLFFTDNFANQWGDDWNDAPYEHNAGEPYEWDYRLSEEENYKNGYGHIRYIAFMDNWLIEMPHSHTCNSPYSVEAINKGAVAWLYDEDAGKLAAGATMAEAKRWLKKAGVLWGELHE